MLKQVEEDLAYRSTGNNVFTSYVRFQVTSNHILAIAFGSTLSR